MLAALAVLSLATPPIGADEASFRREVLPILSDRCFACHGPDAGARKAKLRLDRAAGVFADRGGYAVVVPGDPGASELVARIREAGDDRMPPPDSGLGLSAAEIATLAAWVREGAVWEEHWAFTPPVAVEPPRVEREAWVREDLDRFVLARLERDGLEPAPEADPGALLRRVTLDLTGLPPTLDELVAFLADPSDAAYGAVVERLLASPRYGERMAWDWLDAARYADTDGYQGDPVRDMWPWRDWLVRALNENVPFDELTAAMLAGDLLPGATEEDVLASGFNRNHATNGEGGRIAEETRVENVFDRVETTATVWLGLTVGCARCHDHKFDPVSQEEYYGLFDFFNQTSDSGAGGGGRAAPTLQYLGPEELERIANLEREIAAIDGRMEAPDPALDASQRESEDALALRLADTPELRQRAALGAWSMAGTYEAPGGVGGRTFDHAYLPEQLLTGALDGDEQGPVWRAAEGLEDGTPFGLPTTVGATYLRRVVEAPTERTLILSLGSDDGIRVWLDATEVLTRDVARGVAPDQERLELELSAGRHELLFKIVNTGGAAGFYFRVVEEEVLGLPASLARALLMRRGERSAEDARALRTRFRSEHAPWWGAAEEQRASLANTLAGLRDGAPRVMVMDQLAQNRRRTTHVLERGSYDRPGREVAPHTPAFLPPLPVDAPRDRLALARWLVAPENPLTARVVVNRAWQTLVGRGLVATPDDFGRQGDAPSHPALLDRLARELVASGWDVKALHRAIVRSATYRQSATREAEQYRADPANVRLARGARHRLPAWMLRDQALALSGLLVERRGGPPVRPYQPEGVWAEATFGQIRYEPDHGEALWRRSLYVFWRRIVGPTVLFDGARRQACEVRPSRTNTPLHALVTLNETAYAEAARAFAERVYREEGGARARIARAFRAATARAPEDAEVGLLEARYEEARAYFAANPADATAFLAVGEAPLDAAIPADQLAGLAVVCATILNLDEVLTRP